MWVDIFIISGALGGFCLFSILQLVFFRYFRPAPEKIIKSLLYLYFITAGLMLGFSVWSLEQLGFMDSDFSRLFIIWALMFTIFTLLFTTYLIGIFGVIESSIRIKLLSLIAATHKKGITLKKIYNQYSKESIIDKRLIRLCHSGDVSFLHGKYHLKKRVSPLFLVTKFSGFINWLYK